MGNSSKRSAKKVIRRKKKHAAKDAKKALYQSYTEAGRKKGSKRLHARRRKSLIANVKHIDGFCPNTGCHRCHPREYNISSGQRQLIARGLARWNLMLLKVVPA